MKVYGKDLPEVLTEMPWQLKIVVLAGVVWIPFALIHAVFVFAYVAKDKVRPGLVKINDEAANGGRLDPAIAPSGRLDEMAMVYTEMVPLSTDMGLMGGFAAQTQLVSAHLPCRAWSRNPTVFPARQEEIVTPDGMGSFGQGTWWYETPAIVYDPGDPGRELKVYAYKHLWMGQSKLGIVQHYSTIVYSAKHESDSNAWPRETPLFAARHDDPPEPYGSPDLIHLNDLDPSLANVAFYARPSVLIEKGVYYMTLSAFLQNQVDVDRVIVISSADHGLKWKYVGTLMTRDEAKKMGAYTKLGGGTLMRKGGRIYFAAVFGDEKRAALGTFILRAEDLAQARLERDKKSGLPVVVNKIPNNSTEPTIFGGGYAAYNELCKQGVYVSEHSGKTKNFQLFWTMKEPE